MENRAPKPDGTDHDRGRRRTRALDGRVRRRLRHRQVPPRRVARGRLRRRPSRRARRAQAGGDRVRARGVAPAGDARAQGRDAGRVDSIVERGVREFAPPDDAVERRTGADGYFQSGALPEALATFGASTTRGERAAALGAFGVMTGYLADAMIDRDLIPLGRVEASSPRRGRYRSGPEEGAAPSTPPRSSASRCWRGATAGASGRCSTRWTDAPARWAAGSSGGGSAGRTIRRRRRGEAGGGAGDAIGKGRRRRGASRASRGAGPGTRRVPARGAIRRPGQGRRERRALRGRGEGEASRVSESAGGRPRGPPRRPRLRRRALAPQVPGAARDRHRGRYDDADARATTTPRGGRARGRRLRNCRNDSRFLNALRLGQGSRVRADRAQARRGRGRGRRRRQGVRGGRGAAGVARRDAQKARRVRADVNLVSANKDTHLCEVSDALAGKVPADWSREGKRKGSRSSTVPSSRRSERSARRRARRGNSALENVLRRAGGQVLRRLAEVAPRRGGCRRARRAVVARGARGRDRGFFPGVVHPLGDRAGASLRDAVAGRGSTPAPVRPRARIRRIVRAQRYQARRRRRRAVPAPDGPQHGG